MIDFYGTKIIKTNQMAMKKDVFIKKKTPKTANITFRKQLAQG